jgi:hypothetical protein
VSGSREFRVSAAGGAASIMRKCACGGAQHTGPECEECKKKGTLQRLAVGAATGVPPVVHDVLRQAGQPLDPALRRFMEPRLGHDFSRVRVHTDGVADASARAVNALAFTAGNDVVFSAGQFDPASDSGRRLLAHELTHVIQQSGAGATGPPTRIGDPGDGFEREADRVAARISTGSAESVSPGRVAAVQRQPAPTGITLKDAKPFGHADLKTDDLKQKWRTYIGAATLLQVTPAGDYQGHCAKEYLTEVSNTCPSRFADLREGSAQQGSKKGFCTGDKCLDFGGFGTAGDASTGKTLTDGPDSFLDLHRTRHGESLLEGTGKNECSVVCHQRYAFDRKTDLGSFYIIRNFRADKYSPPGAKSPLHVTTGDIRKVPASLAAPSPEKFAKDIAPGLVKSKELLSAPPDPSAAGKAAAKEPE